MDHKKREGTRRQHKACGESTQHKAENNVKDGQIQNNVKDDQIQNNVMDDQIENNLKDVQIQSNVKDGQREAKVQNDVMGEKRADLQLVRNSQGWDPRTHEEKSGPTVGKRAWPTAGNNWRRLAAAGRTRADGWTERHIRAMMCIRLRTRSSSSQQKRTEESAPPSTHKAAGLTTSWASGTT